MNRNETGYQEMGNNAQGERFVDKRAVRLNEKTRSFRRTSGAAMSLLFVCALLLASCGRTAPGPAISPTPTTPGAQAPVESPSGPPGAGAATETEAGDDGGLNLLVSAQGDVQLKRRAWAEYYTADFGSELFRGDLIRVMSGSVALVLCDGLTTWEVPAGAPAGLNNGCPPPPEAVLVRGTSLFGNTRGTNDPTIPYVISPRKTKLLSATPVLRWNASPDATEYTVSIRGGDVNWIATTPDTEIAYPGEPALAPGQSYALIVEADNGKSSRDEGTPGLGFTLLDEAEAEKVQAAIDKVKSLNLGSEGETLAVAQILTGQGLVAEAIDALEALLAAGDSSPSVQRMLGDSYRQLGLALLAEAPYAEAIELADAANNLEVASAAREGLAEVNISLGNKKAAIELLTQAIAGFKTLGDEEKAATLQARLDALDG